MALWLCWTPSAASSGHAGMLVLAGFMMNMIKSPLLADAWANPVWKFMFLTGIILTGAVAALRRVAKVSEVKISDVAVLAMIGAGGALVAMTAYGRAGTIGWQPGTEMHYGTLAMLLPIAVWIAVSSNVSRITGNVVGVALIILFAHAYQVNYDWRVQSIEGSSKVNVTAALAIAGDDDPAHVAAQYINQYYYVDMPATRKQVAAGIILLRKHERYQAVLQ